MAKHSNEEVTAHVAQEPIAGAAPGERSRLSRRGVLQAACILPLVPGLLHAQAKPTATANAPSLTPLLETLPPPLIGKALLALAPDTTLPAPNPQPPRPQPNSSVPALQDELARFDRIARQVGAITAIVPATMTLFPERLPPPDLFAGLERSQRLLFLLSTLTPPQWRSLGAVDGLGADDLEPAQTAAFFSLLPTPLRYPSVAALTAGTYPPPLTTLSGDQRAQVRLRLNLDTLSGLRLSSTDGRSQPLRIAFANQFLSSGQHRTVLQPPPGRPDSPDATGNPLYGATIPQIIANTLKPGHLNFDLPRLSRAVTPKTGESLGALLERISKDTGTRLYAAPQLADLPVWYRGSNVPLSELLQAVCLAVTGTFRQIETNSDGESAYVLTHSLEGIGQFQAGLTEWASDAFQQAEALMGPLTPGGSDARARLWEAQPLQYLTFAPLDPFALEASYLQKWITAAQKSESEIAVPVTAFGPDAQNAIQARASRAAAQGYGIDSQTVHLSLSTQLYFLLPDKTDAIYIVPDQLPALPFIRKPDPLPAKPSSPYATLTATPFKPTNATKTLLLRASTPADAVAAVLLARQHSISRLWLRLPDSSPALLRAALDEGRKQSVTVWAELSLLSVPPQSAPDHVEINPLGETNAAHARRRAAKGRIIQNPTVRAAVRAKYGTPCDWLRTDDAATRTQAVQRLLAVAAEPGIAGITLINTVAPGYNPARTVTFSDDLDLGYHPTMRLHLLQRGGGDPLDLFDPTAPPKLRLPFFASTPPPRDLWNDLRRAVSTSLLADIYTAVKRAHPDLPLVMRDSAEDPLYGTTWYGSWDAPTQIPGQQSRTNGTPNPTDARAFSQTTYAVLCWQNRLADTAPENAGEYRALVSNWVANLQDGWDGLALDLTPVSLRSAAALLADLGTW